ncbi:MAG: spore germination protein, partial [Thermacetogeniaceae bacterium]
MIRLLAQFLRRRLKKRQDNFSMQLFPEEGHGLLSASLEKNKRTIREIFERCDDLVIRHLAIGGKPGADAMAVFLEPLVDPELLHHCILQPLLSAKITPGFSIKQLRETVISSGEVAEKSSWREVVQEIANGLVGLFVEGEPRALLISVPAENSRSIEKPAAETVIRGPYDAFNEDIRKSLSLLRKRLRTPRLAVESLELGELSKTAVKLVYLKGYVMEGLPEEIKRRLQRIKVDGILGSGQIEEYIQDSPYSFFNHLEITERPDKLAAALLEGRAALFVDGTPFSLIMPVTLNAQLQSPEDYFNRYWFASFIRALRWLGA